MLISQGPSNSNRNVNEKLDVAEKVESSLRGNRIAREILESFERRGIEPKSLAYRLAYIASLDHARKTHSPRLKNLDRQRGMPLRQLKGFPAELNAIAGQIERINATLLSDPPDSLSGFEFRRLPKELRDYAAFLNQCNPSQTRILKESRQSLISDWKQEVRSLVEAVKKKTDNKPRYEDIAELLTATAAALGLDIIYTGGQIKTLVSTLARRSNRLDLPSKQTPWR